MRKTPLVIGGILLLAVGTAWSTTLIKLDFADLATQADRIVVGTVAALDSHWEESGRFIHTDVTIDVERYVAGRGPARLTLRTPGGQIGGRGQVAHGAPSFTLGERVLVFLTTWEDGTPKVLGFAQGKSRVYVGPDGDTRLEGGVVSGRSLGAVEDELRRGPNHNIPLRPVR